MMKKIKNTDEENVCTDSLNTMMIQGMHLTGLQSSVSRTEIRKAKTQLE